MGDMHTASQVQTGDSNKATAQQYSGSSSITQIQNGDNNVAFADQNGQFYGTYGIGTNNVAIQNQIEILIMQVVCKE
jgi:hypothetical protein